MIACRGHACFYVKIRSTLIYWKLYIVMQRSRYRILSDTQ